MKRFLLFLLWASSTLWACATTTFYINHTQKLAFQFPSEIKYVDVGSSLVEVAKMADGHTLLVRSLQANLPSTTLSVVTANGKYHLYTLLYAAHLPFLHYRVEEGEVPSPTIQVAQSQTTHLISPMALTDWALGNDTLIAAHADGIQNMLRLKAVGAFSQEASLALLDEKGGVHTYRLQYVANSPTLSVQLNEQVAADALFRAHPKDTCALNKVARQVLQQPYTNNHLGVVEHKMQLALVGIHSHKDWLMLRLQCQNRNNIDYDIDFIKVYIADKKGSKHTAMQETEVTPFYTYPADGMCQTLHAHQQQDLVLFFHRFTLPKQRILYIELFEKNGGRHLLFTVSPKELLHAKSLQDGLMSQP